MGEIYDPVAGSLLGQDLKRGSLVSTCSTTLSSSWSFFSSFIAHCTQKTLVGGVVGGPLLYHAECVSLRLYIIGTYMSRKPYRWSLIAVHCWDKNNERYRPVDQASKSRSLERCAGCSYTSTLGRSMTSCAPPSRQLLLPLQLKSISAP